MKSTFHTGQRLATSDGSHLSSNDGRPVDVAVSGANCPPLGSPGSLERGAHGSLCEENGTCGLVLREVDGKAMSNAERAGHRLHRALAACSSLSETSTQRDELWFTVQRAVCTNTTFTVAPHGSRNAVEVTPEHATDELISAMQWLLRHEQTARLLSPTALYVALRGHATRGAFGSARAAQADLLRGLTDVPPGAPVTWCDLEETGAA
ncbi:hypothetical protein [Pedococcus sp. 5OH_020]|uniref:hypothetical protein n=1 Tax=Pedococcus sp. 5OH_020 TaxID=2989814 RepID=UPI0022E9CE51|nr:hypothetical protein [Pedococcus sp. 5OH_020]